MARKAYTIGANIKAAELSGISIFKVVTSIFTLTVWWPRSRAW